MASYSRTSLAGTTTFTRANAAKALKLQKNFIKYWRGEVSDAEFKSSIVDAGSSLIEKVFRAPIAKAFTFFAGALADANTYEQTEVLNVAQKGKTQLEALMEIFDANPNYASITFKVNYIKFTNLATGNVDFCIIQGNIVPTKIITTGGGTIPM